MACCEVWCKVKFVRLRGGRGRKHRLADCEPKQFALAEGDEGRDTLCVLKGASDYSKSFNATFLEAYGSCFDEIGPASPRCRELQQEWARLSGCTGRCFDGYIAHEERSRICSADGSSSSAACAAVDMPSCSVSQPALPPSPPSPSQRASPPALTPPDDSTLVNAAAAPETAAADTASNTAFSAMRGAAAFVMAAFVGALVA